MVCDDFANQSVLGAPFEYFLHHLQKQKRLPLDVDKVMAAGRDRYGNESVKLMANYLDDVNKALPTDHRFKGMYANLYHALQSGIWFYIYRRELDRQALSRIRARKSGIYHLKTAHGLFQVGRAVFDENKLRANDKVTYSPGLRDAILGEIDAILQEEEVWRIFFNSWNIKPIELEYEHVAYASSNYLAGIVETLGYQSLEELPQRSLARMSDRHSDDIISAFRAGLSPDTVSLFTRNRSVYAPDDSLYDERHIGTRLN